MTFPFTVSIAQHSRVQFEAPVSDDMGLQKKFLQQNIFP